MIHRYLHKIVTQGIAAITEDTQILNDLFQDNYELDETEFEAIKTYFLANGLNVVNGYPRKNSDYPLAAIILDGEGEVDHFIGDDAGMITDEDDDNYLEDIKASIWNLRYSFYIYTEHPDVTSYYYEILKSIMLAGLTVLIEDGCFEFNISGMDLAPDPRYLPEHLFGRRLLFTCNREFQRIIRDSKLERAFRIDGVFVDKEGGNGDVGDVVTNVTPYTE